MLRGLTGSFSSLDGNLLRVGSVRTPNPERGGRDDLLTGGNDPPNELPRF